MEAPIKERLFAALSDGKPISAKEIVDSTGLDKNKVWDGLYYWWKKGLFLFKGRRGLTRNTRAYYLYVLSPDGKESIRWQGRNFVLYKRKYLDTRGARKTSKAQLILNFLKENIDRAFFSTEIGKRLAEKGVKIRDVMATVRRYERFVYVRGYRTNQRQTPFKEGYLLTWIDQDKSREQDSS